jgi:hypothetical protein
MDLTDENKKRKKGDLRFYRHCLSNIQSSILARYKVTGFDSVQQLSATKLTFDQSSNQVDEKTLLSARDCTPNSAHREGKGSKEDAAKQIDTLETLTASNSEETTKKNLFDQSLSSPQIPHQSSDSLPLVTTRSIFKSPDMTVPIQSAKTKGSVTFSPFILADSAVGTALKETRIISGANFTCPRSLETSGREISCLICIFICYISHIQHYLICNDS